jgi:hypothetical protein
VLHNELLNLLPRYPKEGTEAPTPPIALFNRSELFVGEEAYEEGFSDIVRVMSGYQEGQTLPLHHLTKYPIPLPPCPRLHISLGWTLSESSNVTRHPEPLTLPCNKRTVLLTLFAQAVIDVTRLDVKVEEAANLQKSVQER